MLSPSEKFASLVSAPKPTKLMKRTRAGMDNVETTPAMNVGGRSVSLPFGGWKLLSLCFALSTYEPNLSYLIG